MRRALWLATVADRTAGPLGWLPENETGAEALAETLADLERRAPEAVTAGGWRTETETETETEAETEADKAGLRGLSPEGLDLLALAVGAGLLG